MVGSKGDSIPDGMIEVWVTHSEALWSHRKRIITPYVPREGEQIAVDSVEDEPSRLFNVERVRTYFPSWCDNDYPDINLIVSG